MVLLNLYFSYAILLKGDFRIDDSHSIGDMCLEDYLCLMVIGGLYVS